MYNKNMKITTEDWRPTTGKCDYCRKTKRGLMWFTLGAGLFFACAQHVVTPPQMSEVLEAWANEWGPTPAAPKV